MYDTGEGFRKRSGGRMGGGTRIGAGPGRRVRRERERERCAGRRAAYMLGDYGDQCGKPCLFCAGPTRAHLPHVHIHARARALTHA